RASSAPRARRSRPTIGRAGRSTAAETHGARGPGTGYEGARGNPGGAGISPRIRGSGYLLLLVARVQRAAASAGSSPRGMFRKCPALDTAGRPSAILAQVSPWSPL